MNHVLERFSTFVRGIRGVFAFTLALALPAGVLADHTHDGVTFETAISTEAQLTTLISNGGSGYLTADITVTSGRTLAANKDVKLCLNGYVLTPGYSYSTPMFTLNSNAKLMICCCQETEHKFSVGATGLWVRDELNGTKILRGGCITGNKRQTIDNATYGDGASIVLRKVNFVGNYTNGSSGAGSGDSLYGHSICANDCCFAGNTNNYDQGAVVYLRVASGHTSVPSGFTNCTFVANAHAGRGAPDMYMSAPADFYNCRFEDGSSPGGSGCVSIYAQSRFTKCDFINNVGGAQGGVAYLGKQVTFDDCQFISNRMASVSDSASGVFKVSGSGVYSYPMLVTNCVFKGNSGNSGILYCYYGTSAGVFTFVDCLITDNTAASKGGAIFSESDPIVAKRCTFARNTAAEGGAIYAQSNTPDISGCCFATNTAKTGGAIYTMKGLKLKDSVLLGNTATNDYGGAVYATSAYTNVMISGCQIVGNGARTSGGGVYSGLPTVVGGDCVIRGNTNGTGTASNLLLNNGTLGYITDAPLTTGSDVRFQVNNATPTAGSPKQVTATCDFDVSSFVTYENYNWKVRNVADNPAAQYLEISVRDTSDQLIISGGKVYRNSVEAGNETTITGLSYADGVWTMNGVSYMTTGAAALSSDEVLTIVLVGDNTIASGNVTASGANSYGIYAPAGLKVRGDGTLTVRSGTSASGRSIAVYAAEQAPSAVAEDDLGTALSYDTVKRSYVVAAGAEASVVVLKKPNTIEYRVPTYKVANDPKSGIASWSTLEIPEPQATSVSATDLTWGDDGNDGWYVLDSDVTVNDNSYTVSGNVKLILKNGFTLTASALVSSTHAVGLCAIQIPKDCSLTIYAQSDNAAEMGAIVASGGVRSGGIGYSTNGKGGTGGTLIINGGKIEGTGRGNYTENQYGFGGAGIGSGARTTFTLLAVNGGVITARGGSNAAGLGVGGCDSSAIPDGFPIVINGGVINAYGGNSSNSYVGGGAGVGAGGCGRGFASAGYLGKVYLNGGRIYAQGGVGGAGKGSAIGYGYGTLPTVSKSEKFINVNAEMWVKVGDDPAAMTEVEHTGGNLYEIINGWQYASVLLPVPGDVVEQPTSINNFTFVVYTNGYSGTVTYQWYRKTGETTSEAIVGETAAQLSLDKQVVGETYYCKAMFTSTGALDPESIVTSAAAVKYHSHDGVAFVTAIGTEAELRAFCAANGTGYLTADITLTSDFYFNNGITNRLCLNGHVLKQDESCIGISGGRYLAIYDCDKTTPHYFDANTQYGNWTPTNEVTENVVYGGYILGVHAGDVGSGDNIYVGGGSCFEFCGGTLVGVLSEEVISVAGGSQLSISGGDIVGNCSEKGIELVHGLSVYTNILRVTAGTFRNNTSWYHVMSYPGCRVEVLGGVFRDNVGLESWGTIIYGYDSKVVIGGDTVISNNATLGSSAVMVYKETYPTSLEIRDNAQIVGNRGTAYGGGVLTWSGVSVSVSGRVRIADNEGGSFVVWTDVSGSADAPVISNDTYDFSGLEDGASIGLSARGTHYETGSSYVLLPRYAGEPIVVSTNLTEGVMALLHTDYKDQYLEKVVSGGTTKLLLRGRLIAEPSAVNNFTYSLDTKHYSGALDEGTTQYQWYPSTMTGRVIKSVDPDVPETCQYCTRWPTTFDPTLDCWTASTNGIAADSREYAFVGFAAKQGDIVRYVARPCVSYEPWIGNAVDYYTYNYCTVVEERPDGLVEYEAIVPADGDYYIVEWFDQMPSYDTYIISNLTVTAQAIDYAHPIAGQTGAAYDFATSPVDEGSFANVASFIDADGITTNFTMKSGIIGFHVNRDKDGNVVARYDQPIDSQAALEALFQNGGAGYLTADFRMSAAGEEFDIAAGTVVDLCLNGHVLDLNGGFISNEGTLRIVDCLDHATPHYFAVGADRRWVLTNDVTAAKCVKGGVIYNGFHADGDEDNPAAVSALVAATTVVSRVNFIGNGSAIYVGAYKSGAQAELTKTVVEDCFIAGNVISGLGTIVVGNGTNHVFRNSVLTENLGWACGGIGSIEGPGFTMIDMTITNNYATGFNAYGISVGFGGAVFLSQQPVLGGKIVITNNYVLIDGGAVPSNAGFFEFEMNPAVVFGPAVLLPSFSADSKIGVREVNSSMGEVQPCPFILALTNDTDFSSCFVADDGISIISYNAFGQVQLITDAVVHFESNGGTPIASTNTLVGLKILKPADPVRYGFAFNGWYRDTDCTQAWDFDSDVVPKPDFTLYAGWTEMTKLTYSAAGGFYSDGAEVKIVFASPTSPTYEFPEQPVRTGYNFEGWYIGVTNGSTKVAEGDAVTGTNLFAWWSAVQDPVHPIVYETSFTGGLTSDGYGATNIQPTAVLAASGNTDIVIPDKIGGISLLDVGRNAFRKSYYDGTVTSVKIGTFVTHIRPYAFRGSAVTNVEFSVPHDYLTGAKTTLYIQDRAFWETEIETLVFPAGGSYSLGQNTFSDNDTIKDVYFYGELDKDCWKLSPFRHIGEGRTAANAVRFHLRPSQAADADFVWALTNGMDAACIVLDQNVLGRVKTGSLSTGADTLVIDFTINADSPWQTATVGNTYLLFSGDVTEVVVGKGNVLKPESVEKLPDGSYKATFAKPAEATGFFVVCVGD